MMFNFIEVFPQAFPKPTLTHDQNKKNFTCNKLEVSGFPPPVFCTVELQFLWLVAWLTTLPANNRIFKKFKISFFF